MSIENGDMPAMPVECQFSTDEKIHGLQTGNYSGWSIGLTKREQFAAMAMQGLLANPKGWDQKDEILAVCATEVADALLAELAKKAGDA